MRIEKAVKWKPKLIYRSTGPVFVTLTFKIFMKPREQLNLMDKIIRELDDLKNSQTSLLKKIAQIEADNINLNIDLLGDQLPGIHEEVDDALEKSSALLDQFTEYRNKYEQDNQSSLVEPSWAYHWTDLFSH